MAIYGSFKLRRPVGNATVQPSGNVRLGERLRGIYEQFDDAAPHVPVVITGGSVPLTPMRIYTPYGPGFFEGFQEEDPTNIGLDPDKARLTQFTLIKAPPPSAMGPIQFQISGKVGSLHGTQSVVIAPPTNELSITIEKVQPGAIRPGILVGGLPTTKKLMIFWLVSVEPRIPKMLDFYNTIEDGLQAPSRPHPVVNVDPTPIPGLDYDPRLGGRWLVQIAPGAFSGTVTAQVYDASVPGVTPLMGIPTLAVTGPF